MALLVVASLSLCGCSSGGVTASKLENAVAPTFANLVHVQELTLHANPTDPTSLRVTASCDKVGAKRGGSGPGDYKCTLLWLIPGQRTPVHDGYEVSVTMDGCYTAKVDGDEARMGGPTITARDGTSVTNLLYAFDGCFDADGASDGRP
jgi:hypothetical protein